MADRDWLAGWNCRYARLLAAVQTSDARAALVDTNGDGRELWFALDVRSTSGEWEIAFDWDDASGQHAPERIEECGIVFGWGRGRPAQRMVVECDGLRLPVDVGASGWWLLLASLSRGRDPGST